MKLTLSEAAEIIRTAAYEAECQNESAEMWCPGHLYQGVRHLQRNCDVECPTHEAWGEDDRSEECIQPGRYAGPYIALMSPVIGRAIADFLDDVASDSVPHSYAHLATANRIVANIEKIADARDYVNRGKS